MYNKIVIIIIILIVLLLLLYCKNSVNIVEKFQGCQDKLEIQEEAMNDKKPEISEIPEIYDLPNQFTVSDINRLPDNPNNNYPEQDYIDIAQCLVDYTGIINFKKDNIDWPLYKDKKTYDMFSLTPSKDPIFKSVLPELKNEDDHKLFCSDYNKIEDGFSIIHDTDGCNTNERCNVDSFKDATTITNNNICKYKSRDDSNKCNENILNVLTGGADVISSKCKALIRKHWEAISIVNGIVNDCIDDK